MNNFPIFVILWSAWNIQPIILPPPEAPSFTQQMKNPWFVDKTLLIKKMLHHLNGTYHLLTYPSKFGKTSNLKMIQSFVELEVDTLGQVKKKWETKSYKLFTNKSLGLKIAQYHDVIRKHLAEYPVIYVTFKDIIRPTFEETILKLTKRIRGCYEKFHWLYEILRNDSLQEKSDEWGYLLRGQVEFWNRTYGNRCRPVDLQNSLFALSKILCYYLDRKIFVLIDDYDAPLIEAQTLGAEITFDVFLVQDYVNGIIQKLFKPTCVDQYIEFGFIAGTTSYFVSSFFTKIENITYYRFLDNHIFAPFFGFDRQEIHILLHRYRVVYPEHKDMDTRLPTIFSGYQVGNSSRRMYNPYFYSKYFDERNQTQKSLNVIEKGLLSSIIRNPRIRECLMEVLKLKLIRFKLLTHITVSDFRKLFKATGNGTGNENDLDFDFDVFYTLLFEIGYLSYTNLDDVFIVPKEIANIFTT